MRTIDPQPEIRTFYVGRRSFVEELNAFGTVARRWLTTGNFGKWLVSDPGGDVSFMGRTDNPTWAKMIHATAKDDDLIIKECGTIRDYAPPGFNGNYCLAGGHHFDVDENLYFMTFKDVIVVYDTVNGTCYISLDPLEKMVEELIGDNLRDYCKRLGVGSPYSIKAGCRAIEGIPSLFTKLTSLHPLLDDRGHTHLRTQSWESGHTRMRQKHYPALNKLVSSISKMSRPPRKKPEPFTPRPSESVHLVFNPKDHNRFKIIVYQRTIHNQSFPGPTNAKIFYCAEGWVDYEAGRAFIGDMPYTRAVSMANGGKGWVNKFDKRIAPMLDFTPYRDGFRTFASHDAQREKNIVVRMYGTPMGMVYVNLLDFLRVCRVDLLRSASHLLSQEAVQYDALKDKYPEITFYDEHLVPISYWLEGVPFYLQDLRVSITEVAGMYSNIEEEHRLARTHAFHHGTPTAIRAIKESFIDVDEIYYETLPIRGGRET